MGRPEYAEHSLRPGSQLAKVVKNDQFAAPQASKVAKPVLREDSTSPILLRFFFAVDWFDFDNALRGDRTRTRKGWIY